jgi:hypothetical protein
VIARFPPGIYEHAVLLGKPAPAKGQSEVPDVLEEGTYPKALWFVSRAYLRAVKGFHQRGDVEDRLGYHVGQLGRKERNHFEFKENS